MVTVARYLFIVINTFHIVLGVLVAAFGFWLQYASPIKEVLNRDATSLSVIYFTIALGFLLLAFGAIGAFGNMVTNKKVLGVYLVFNVAIVILEIAAVGYGYSQRNSVQTHVQTVWNTMPLVDRAIIQNRFNCCGFTGPAEYNLQYPASCYQNATANLVWATGCYPSLIFWFDQNVTYLGVMIGLLMVASVLQIILSSKLLYNIIKRPNAVATEEYGEIDSDDEDKRSRDRSSSRMSQTNYQHLT